MRTPCRFRNILDGCRLSSSKWSAELNRAKPPAQGMKSTDPLLNAWRQTLRRAKDGPAIVNTCGEVLRKFVDVEKRACDLESNVEMFSTGSVIAVQIGNHEDWPSILIACLRRRLVVLPLEQSINDQQRDAALRLCKARAVVSDVPDGNSLEIFQLKIGRAHV